MFDEHLTHLDAEATRTYLHGGRTPAIGAPLAQPNLAGTFRRIGREGIQVVYGGQFGDGIVAALGGIMSRRDLETYPERLRWDDPITTTYRDVEVFTAPPPSSGSQVLQTLNGMAGWNGPRSPPRRTISRSSRKPRAARLGASPHRGPRRTSRRPAERRAHRAIRAEMRARLTPCASRSQSPGQRRGLRGVHDSPVRHGRERSRRQRGQSLGNGFGSGMVVPGPDLPQQRASLTSTDAGHPNVVQPGKRLSGP
jgi:gamma-glutamyltranspeptidase/glutathione hydrolase